MTDNIIKEALEAAKGFTDPKDFWGGDKHRAKVAADKINAALSLIESGEVMWESEVIFYPKVLHERRNEDAWIIQPVLVIPLGEET